MATTPALRPVQAACFSSSFSRRTVGLPLSKPFGPQPTSRTILRGTRPAVSSNESKPTDQEAELIAGQTTFGEDAAAFDLSNQSVKDWGAFFGLLTVVLGGLYLVWIDPNFGVGGEFVAGIESMFTSSEATMLGILLVFAIAHSGLAYLRPYGEDLIGARAYRVIFALVSLPLAVAAVVYFINHRYDGTALWNIR